MSNHLRKIFLLLSASLASAVLLGCATMGPSAEPVQKVLSEKVRQGRVPCGVFLYLSPDGEIVTASAGWLDEERKTPVDEKTLFWVASMTKGVTGLAFMILVDEGKTTLDTPVCKVLPEFAGKPELKMRHLLTHVHGLVLPASKWRMTSLADYSREAAAKPYRWKPGEKYEYGDGPCIAGRVIEVLSSMEYEEFLRKRIFEPVGMTDTSFNPSPAQTDRLMPIVRWNEKEGKFLPWEWKKIFGKELAEYRYPAPSAGIFSTASDYAKLIRMLLNGGLTPNGTRIVSASSIAELGKNQVLDIPGRSYGLGFGGNPDCFWHAGTAGTTWWIRPATHRGYVWMTNVIGMYGGISETREACALAAEIYDPPDELSAWKTKYNVK